MHTTTFAIYCSFVVPAGIVPFGARRSEGCLDHGGHGEIGSTPKHDGKAKTGTPPACCIDIKLARGMIG